MLRSFDLPPIQCTTGEVKMLAQGASPQNWSSQKWSFLALQTFLQIINELTRLHSEYSKNETKQRQIEIHAGIEGVRKKNSNYFEEGIEICELMKNIENQYVKADPEQKHRIMKILVRNRN